MMITRNTVEERRRNNSSNQASSDKKVKCKHSCVACDECFSRIENKVILNLLPLLAKLVRGETEALNEVLLKLQNKNVPEQWEDREENTLDGLRDVEQACQHMKSMKSRVNDIPALQHKLVEICIQFKFENFRKFFSEKGENSGTHI